MGDTNLHNIEGIVIAECPSCGDESAFLYTGIQNGYQGFPDFVLYHCFKCETTLSHSRILHD